MDMTALGRQDGRPIVEDLRDCVKDVPKPAVINATRTILDYLDDKLSRCNPKAAVG